MAAVPITPTVLDRTGITQPAPITGASIDGFILPQSGGRTFLEIKNADTVTHTITLVTPNTAPEGLAIADPTVTIAAGVTKLIGPFGPVFGFTEVMITTDVTVDFKLEIRAYRLTAV